MSFFLGRDSSVPSHDMMETKMTFSLDSLLAMSAADLDAQLEGALAAIVELDETQLSAVAGGRAPGGSGGKVGEVPVVTG
jgi:hypothetical protein